MNDIVKFLISSSAIIAAVSYLAKVILDKIAEAKIEKYKSDLSLESLNFKNSLDKLSTEHQIKYSKLYEERGQVIKSVYTLLYNLEISLRQLTTPLQGGDWVNISDKDRDVNTSINQLDEKLELNRIFFSEPLCEKIQSIIDDARIINNRMYSAKKKAQHNNSPSKQALGNTLKDLLEPTETWSEMDLKVQNDIKKARLDLAQDFRNLIGVE